MRKVLEERLNSENLKSLREDINNFDIAKEIKKNTHNFVENIINGEDSEERMLQERQKNFNDFQPDPSLLDKMNQIEKNLSESNSSEDIKSIDNEDLRESEPLGESSATDNQDSNESNVSNDKEVNTMKKKKNKNKTNKPKTINEKMVQEVLEMQEQASNEIINEMNVLGKTILREDEVIINHSTIEEQSEPTVEPSEPVEQESTVEPSEPVEQESTVEPSEPTVEQESVEEQPTVEPSEPNVEPDTQSTKHIFISLKEDLDKCSNLMEVHKLVKDILRIKNNSLTLTDSLTTKLISALLSTTDRITSQHKLQELISKIRKLEDVPVVLREITEDVEHLSVIYDDVIKAIK